MSGTFVLEKFMNDLFSAKKRFGAKNHGKKLHDTVCTYGFKGRKVRDETDKGNLKKMQTKKTISGGVLRQCGHLKFHS